MAEQQLIKKITDAGIIGAKLKTFRRSEEGSISLLLIFLFLITTITSLVVVDVADAYLAKRQLTQVAEAAAQTGSHQIDLTRYYSGGLIDSGLGYQLVPISCNSAILYAQRYLYSNSLRGNPIYMTGWNCENEKVRINVRSEIRPLISLPIVVGSFGQRLLISSSVIATSVVR
jgi:hypothetical protein